MSLHQERLLTRSGSRSHNRNIQQVIAITTPEFGIDFPAAFCVLNILTYGSVFTDLVKIQECKFYFHTDCFKQYEYEKFEKIKQNIDTN